MSDGTTTASGSGLRVCTPIFSTFARQAFRFGHREAQDVLADCASVDFIDLRPRGGFALAQNILTRLLYRDVLGIVAFRNPGLKPVRLQKDYDLFVLVCPYWRDVWYANAIENWKDRCRTSVCWIDELWIASLPGLRNWLPILEQFDHVFVGTRGSDRALGDAIGRVCHELSGAVDTLRFSPMPDPPARVIDIYSIGRRVEAVHEGLLQAASEKGLFYVHDTLQHGDSVADDYRAHREMYANMAKRSRLFMVAPGKVTRLDQTSGQADIGYRYFEGVGAGAVLLGQAPDTPAFAELFDWPDALVEIRPDGSDTADTVSRLLDDPARLWRMSLRNTAEALRRHDWVHRWRRIFEIVGLEPTPGMLDREARLGELAERATQMAG